MDRKKDQKDPRVQDTGRHVKPGSVKLLPRTKPPKHAKKP